MVFTSEPSLLWYLPSIMYSIYIYGKQQICNKNGVNDAILPKKKCVYSN